MKLKKNRTERGIHSAPLRPPLFVFIFLLIQQHFLYLALQFPCFEQNTPCYAWAKTCSCGRQKLSNSLILWSQRFYTFRRCSGISKRWTKTFARSFVTFCLRRQHHSKEQRGISLFRNLVNVGSIFHYVSVLRKCYFCGLVISLWLSYDQQHAPNHKFFNPPLPYSQNTWILKSPQRSYCSTYSDIRNTYSLVSTVYIMD